VYSQGPRRKFSTYLYDLEDDPRTSQLYLGQNWEKYHQNQKSILTKTTGQIVTFDGKAVIAPYFTQSGGHSSDAWAKQYPWAKVQPLPYDEGLDAKGHGIGLSGNTAHILADKGMKHEDIIDYFFEGVEVEKKY
jgi:peptidoglycan hydrolase-like amidase